MRIIAGEYRGRKIKTISSDLTRPTTDKIKESLFHRLGPFFSGGHCLDLFAGSGALGIEALSRGFERAVFVDRHPQAIKIIRHNLELLQIPKERSTVWRLDAFQALRRLEKTKQTFQLIFVDPPYGKINFNHLLKEISERHLLATDGVICCEHHSMESLPKQIKDFTLDKQISYGQTTSISLYGYDINK